MGPRGRTVRMGQCITSETVSHAVYKQIGDVDLRLSIRDVPVERVELAHNHAIQQPCEDWKWFPVSGRVNHEGAMREPWLVYDLDRHSTDCVDVGIKVPVY